MISYVEVTPTIFQPSGPPGGVPRGGGHHPNKGTAQRTGHPEGAAPQSWLIEHNLPFVVQPLKKPSQIAWDAYRPCQQITKQKYGKILLDFCNYMDMCDNSGFSAEGIAVTSYCKPYSKVAPKSNNDWGKRNVSGPLLNRWHPQRRLRWLAKMYQLALWYEANRIEGCTLISLTGYQENSGLSIYDTWDNINESRGKILKILRKVFPKLDYFWVVEPHTENNTGYPHYHLAVFKEIDNSIIDTYGEGMEDKLRRLYSKEWKTGSHTYGLNFKIMKGENSIKDLKNYLMKYIAKGYVNNAGWSEAELIFNAHLYGATHGFRPAKDGEKLDYRGQYSKKYRLIGMSQNLSKLLKPEEEQKEQIVWLHTDETEPQEIRNEEGEWETMERKKVLYHRQLIPDFTLYDIVGVYIKDKKPFYGYLHHNPKIKPIIMRNISITDQQWGRELSKKGSWTSQVYDEKAARRQRNKDTSW